MLSVAKVCGNKPTDLPGLFEIIASFREEQLRIFGEQKIDPRVGLLVGRRHPSPDFVDIREASSIIQDAPSGAIVVVTHLDTLTEQIDLIGETGAETIQIHTKRPKPEDIEVLKKHYPNRHFWHVIHAPQRYADPAKTQRAERDTLAMAEELFSLGVTVVLDSFDIASGRVGGTGLAVEEGYAKRFINDLRKGGSKGRVILAGGLQPHNVIDKIREIRPDGIDANTGLNISKDNRSKDPRKVRAYLGGALEGAYHRRPSGLWVC